jgi:hypothetical protein
MSIKDQIRDYDVAFNRAKSAYGTGAYDDATLEFLFPELKESEDERIRKELVEYHKKQFEKNRDQEIGIFHKDALAYLEKHKVENVSASTMIPSCWADEHPKEQKPWKVGANAYFTPEQKLAEVDESTKRLNDNWMKQHFDDYEEQKPVMSREKILHQLFQNGSITLSDYLYLTGEQKPAEGDNETEIQKAFREGKSAGRKEVFDHPEEYGLQKPAEWSEEDEDILNCCISSIEEAKENRYAYKETDGDTSYDHEISWLKSLRPQWRPSEEQMEALLWCIAHLGGADRRVLAELYEHLKNLM